jgi:cytoskeletal protein CcmA (bactofilin family)
MRLEGSSRDGAPCPGAPYPPARAARRAARAGKSCIRHVCVIRSQHRMRRSGNMWSMADIPKRRLFDQLGFAPSYIAAGCRITGDVEAPGALVMCGQVRGDGDVKGFLSLAVNARWDGEIHARSAVLAGTVTGAIRVDEKIEIRATALIRGQITARKIAIARGAVIEGEVTVTGGEPIITFEEKRAR